jgi:hypothetical protein
MVSKKTTTKNLLTDKEWSKKFTEALQKDIKRSRGKKTSSGLISEIVCTEKDIGKPFGSKTK